MLAVLLMLASLAVADEGPTVAPSLVAQRGGRWLVEASGIGWTPGTTVAVYLEEVRPDPRGGEPIVGLRYAGDARISWVGPDLIELLPERPEVVAAGTGVRLGEPLGAEPTPAWVPPGPHPVAVVESAPEPVAPPREASEPFEPAWTRAVSGEALGRLTDEPGLPQALVVEGGFTGDGYDTGAAWGAVGWQLRPPVGPGQIEVRLEGLRGERWVEGKGDEPYATEPAVGYWLLGRVDTAGVGLGVYGVLGAGVDERAGTKSFRGIGGKWRQVELIFRHWAERVAKRLGAARS